MNQKTLEFKHIISNYIAEKANELLDDEQFINDLTKATTFAEISSAFLDWDIDEFHLDECIGLYFAK